MADGGRSPDRETKPDRAEGWSPHTPAARVRWIALDDCRSACCARVFVLPAQTNVSGKERSPLTDKDLITAAMKVQLDLELDELEARKWQAVADDDQKHALEACWESEYAEIRERVLDMVKRERETLKSALAAKTNELAATTEALQEVREAFETFKREMETLMVIARLEPTSSNMQASTTLEPAR
jgi:hypothetical protein